MSVDSELSRGISEERRMTTSEHALGFAIRLRLEDEEDERVFLQYWLVGKTIVLWYHPLF